MILKDILDRPKLHGHYHDLECSFSGNENNLTLIVTSKLIMDVDDLNIILSFFVHKYHDI